MTVTIDTSGWADFENGTNTSGGACSNPIQSAGFVYTCTYTPVGVPTGIAIGLKYFSGGGGAFTGPVTYGGVDMGSAVGQIQVGASTEFIFLIGLGSGVPAGPQTVSMTTTLGFSATRFGVMSVTGNNTSVAGLFRAGSSVVGNNNSSNNVGVTLSVFSPGDLLFDVTYNTSFFDAVNQSGFTPWWQFPSLPSTVSAGVGGSTYSVPNGAPGTIGDLYNLSGTGANALSAASIQTLNPPPSGATIAATPFQSTGFVRRPIIIGYAPSMMGYARSIFRKPKRRIIRPALIPC